ncbi:MAG: FKBP-type peptidyl-prolyl cis-trans isomerase [Phenylobacterium sp.]|uniref:FKBP-type peptidyl-prolyl cis-trans isomerase n=1 Tax=Phenylobacterium sp. TaxID=1871053 RepID=UPI00391B1BFF
MRRVLLAIAAAASLAACSPKADPGALAASAAEAKAFMDKNAGAEGVKTLPSGLQYKVVRSGPPGGMRPQETDEVKVHYEGKFVDGKVFDSSYERGLPAAMPLKALIPAWVEALQLMRPGDEWMLYVPPELGYGEQGAGGGEIPPNSVLIFRIELIDVLPGPGRVAQG